MAETPRFSVVPYRGHEEETLDLRNRSRPGASKSRVYLDWRYLGEPSEREPLVFRLHEGGKAMAMTGMAFRRYHVDGEPVSFAVLGDISVDVGHRGRGLSGQLYRHINAHLTSHRLTGFVMPNALAVHGLVSAGWRTNGSLLTYACVLNAREKIRRVFPLLSKPVAGAMRIVTKAMASSKTMCGISMRQTEAFDDDFEQFWLRLSKKNRVLRDRSLATLRWRYECQPGARYTITKFFDGVRFAGYAVSDTMTPGDCLLSDFIVEEPHQFKPCMARFLIETMRDESVNTVRIVVNDRNGDIKSLRGFGFVKREPTTHFKTHNSQHPLIDDPDAWLITAGDKDA